jgi:HSP20 family protein
MLTLRRDIDDVLDELVSPRGLRRDIERLLSEDLSPRAMWMEMDRLLDDTEAPQSLRRRLERVFEEFRSAFGGALGTSGGGMRGRGLFVPDIEMAERDNEIVLTVDLPGVRRDDIEIRVDDDNVLTIHGERREEESRQARGYEYTERTYGAFSRSIELPRNVDTSRIEADLRQGVLEIHVPKTQAAAGRQIPIGQAGQRMIAGGDGGRAEAREGQVRSQQDQQRR